MRSGQRRGRGWTGIWPLGPVGLLALSACASPAPSSPSPPAWVETDTRSVRHLDTWTFAGGDWPRTRGTSPRTEGPDGASVRVPHRWPASADAPSQVGWYRRMLQLRPEQRNRRHFLRFDAAATAAEVFVNGRAVGQHLGAYTAFTLDVTDAFDQLVNRVDVRVSNRPEETVSALPSSEGRQLYLIDGGLYRHVSLISTHPLHIDPTDHGSSGVRFRTPAVRPEGASFEVAARVRNSLDRAASVRIEIVLVDEANAVAWRHAVPADLAAGEARDVRVAGTLRQPRLWRLGDPSLYTLHVGVAHRGRVVDRVSERVGFRDFRLLPDGHFALNGTPMAIRGIGRHQGQDEKGYALDEAFVRRDFEELRELGVNMVRLAHYPHAEIAYDLADEMGILVWAENGNSNEGRPGKAGERITREMVRQLRNHPSVVIWCVGNETNFSGVARYSHVVRTEDPQRLVTYSSNTKPPPRARRALDFIAFNVYTGWYSGEIGAWDNAARRFRYVSETGAGAVLTNHVDYAKAVHHVDTFESEELAQKLFEFQLDTVFRREPQQIPMYSVWILRDFAIDKYKDRLNTKGLLTRGGRRKDPFHLYQSFLRPAAPVVHITSKTYFLRSDSPDNGIKAYSNRPRLRLWLNGADAGWQENGALAASPRQANVFYWPVTLRPGRNHVRVDDGEGHEDEAIVYQWSEHATADPADPIGDVTSSNPRNPAVFIAAPLLDEGPFYYELDASADNSWTSIPEALSDAHWIATRRLSKPEMRTTLGFTARQALDVYVVVTKDRDAGLQGWCPGFAPTEIEGWWRDNDLERVPFAVLHRAARAGERLTIPGATRDYVVVVKPAKSRSPAGS